VAVKHKTFIHMMAVKDKTFISIAIELISISSVQILYSDIDLFTIFSLLCIITIHL
jgi:hypothetical protein